MKNELVNMLRNSYTKTVTSDAINYTPVYDVLPSDRERVAELIEQQESTIGGLMQIIDSQKETNLAIIKKYQKQVKFANLGQAAEFCIINNGCEGELSEDDFCKFCFMREFCLQRGGQDD